MITCEFSFQKKWNESVKYRQNLMNWSNVTLLRFLASFDFSLFFRTFMRKKTWLIPNQSGFITNREEPYKTLALFRDTHFMNDLSAISLIFTAGNIVWKSCTILHSSNPAALLNCIFLFVAIFSDFLFWNWLKHIFRSFLAQITLITFEWNIWMFKETVKILTVFCLQTFAEVPLWKVLFQHVVRKKSWRLKKRAVSSDPRRRKMSRVFRAQHPGSSVRLLPWCRAVQWRRQ